MAPARRLTFSAERAVEAGRYRREGFEPPFTIDVPDGWFAVQDVPGFFDLGREVATLDIPAVQFARPSDLTDAATAGSVRTWGSSSNRRRTDPELDSIRLTRQLRRILGLIGVSSTPPRVRSTRNARVSGSTATASASSRPAKSRPTLSSTA